MLGILWTHPGGAHTTFNVKHTGNVNSDAAHHDTVHLDAVCQAALRPDAARHGTMPPDAIGTVSAYRTEHVRVFSFWTHPCQGIFLLDPSVSGHFPSGHSRVRAFSFWRQPCQGKWCPDDVFHGTVVMLAVKARNIAANTLVTFTNTQQVPGIVTQFSSILYI